MIRIVSALLILWGCAFAQAPIDIVSSTPLGMPCGGISTLGCMPDAQCGWMVVVKTGDAAAFAGKLTYTDTEGKEQTATATAASTGEYTALAFRVGVFRPDTGNRFVAVEMSALQPVATVRQDAAGAIITVGATTWGPPKQAQWPPPGTWAWADIGEHAGGRILLSLKFIDGKVIVEQPEVAMHPADVRSGLSRTVRLVGESLRLTPRITGIAIPILKEHHQ